MVENIVYGIANRNQPILKNINSSLEGGDALWLNRAKALAGKSTFGEINIRSVKPYSGQCVLMVACIQWKRKIWADVDFCPGIDFQGTEKNIAVKPSGDTFIKPR